MILAHRIALDPTFTQRGYFARAAGTARFTWNWALAEWDRRYAAGEKPNGTTLKAAFNAIKYDAFGWLKDIHRDAHARPFANLHRAFTAYFKGIAQRPTFKKKGKCHDSFYVANDKLRLDGDRVRLPVVGWVRLREQLRFVGKIVGAVVSREGQRWFVSIQVDVGSYQQPRSGDGELGIDVGLNAFATLSTGVKIIAPKPLRSALGQLRRCARKVSRRQRGSSRRDRAKRVLARIHARVKNIRGDFLHKLSTRLCRENQALGVESLAVKNLLRNHKLALSIADARWGEFLRQLHYKGTIFACRIIEAERFYPSSKRCHRCRQVKESLALSERVFVCQRCGLACDRDVNASLNLLPQALREVTAVDSMVRPGQQTGSEDDWQLNRAHFYAQIRKQNWVWSPQGTINMHRPEQWGYLQFSTAAPGKAAFKPDAAGSAKHLLHRIHEAQKKYVKEHGRFARTLDDLKLVDLRDATLVGPPSLEASADRFRATVNVKLPNGDSQRWHIREDSRLWKNP